MTLRAPTPDDLSQLESLYARARFLDSHVLLSELTPPEDWSDTDGRLLAARTLNNLGATPHARRLLRSTLRRDPASEAARYYHALEFHEQHGSFETLRVLFARDPSERPAAGDGAAASPAPSKYVAWHWLLRARCLADFRDFDSAELWLAAAERALPDDPWTQVEKACLRLRADRYADALAAADAALVLRPDYRPAVTTRAHLLTLLNRDAEAVTLLRHALGEMQSTHVAMQLAQLLIEQANFPDALEVLDASVRFSPLAAPLRPWQRARQADALYQLGRFSEALVPAREVPGSYYENFVRRLEAKAASATRAPARVQLPVGFVRQHHLTCAPATLAAISSFWSAPIDHLALAQVITYDGTPDHEERHWLERHGWHVREFRVTWEVATALLARGVPFTLVTTWTRAAHLQAVIGCDPLLGTFIIRDPTHRAHQEVLATEFLEQQAPYGPRGMVLLPAAEAHRLADLDLPDAARYDAFFRLRRALLLHDRATAEQEVSALAASAPDHRLTLHARRELACYDDHPERTYEITLALRAQFPDEPNLRFDELGSLQRLGRRSEHLARLREFAHRPGTDPGFQRDYAEHLRTDAREHPHARRTARRLVHRRPLDWQNLLTFAHTLWDQRAYPDAVRVYRLAATLGEKSEFPWSAYFAAARFAHRTDEALSLLRTRFQNLGASSAQPALTLQRCLSQLDRDPESFDIFAQALALRPEDGELHLAAAQARARHGDFARAASHLETARARTAPALWHRTAAQLAAWRADHAAALGHWREILKTNPLDPTALASTARLLALTAGRAFTLSWLREEIARFPHFLPLRQLRLEWLRSEPPAIALAELADYLALQPTDAWALREKALALLRAQSPDKALALAQLAEQIDPQAPHSAGIVGQVLGSLRRFPEARAATERALRLSIDADWLMPQLIAQCPEFSERRAAIAFFQDELTRQVSQGGAFLRFREMAIGIFSPDELQSALDALRAAQPEHWETWIACAQQSLARHRADDALALTTEATQRFPLVPRAWLELADVHRFRGETDSEIAALTRARELSPGWAEPALRLASLHEHALRNADAEATLRSVLLHDPLDARLHTHHARALHRLGRIDEALTAAERAATLAPDYAEPWRLLADLARARDSGNITVALARRLATERPGDVAPRTRLAKELAETQDFATALAELDTALALTPGDADLHDLRAVLLAWLGRYDDALAACAPAVFASAPPVSLSGRAAWVEWQRNNRSGAIAALRAVVAQHPDYSFGWRTLVEWLDETGERKAAAEAAEKIAALEPASPYPLGWIADLKIKAGEKTAALEYLRRALRIDPAYSYASLTLFQLACEQERFAEAESVLALIRQHSSAWAALRCEILLHRSRLDQAAAIRALRALCLAPEHETQSLSSASFIFREAKWVGPLEATLVEALREPTANPEAGALLIQSRLRAGRNPRLSALDKSCPNEIARHRAWIVYLNWLGETNRPWRLRWSLWRRGSWLHAADDTWGAVGFALRKTAHDRKLVHWMRDWSQRAKVEPWMLHNLAHSLLTLGREAEFPRVVAAGLALPADNARPMFVAWAALDRGLAGDLAGARRHLAAFDQNTDRLFAKVAAAQARALVEVCSRPVAERPAAFREARANLAALKKEQHAVFAHAYVRRQHAQVLRVIASATGARWWRWWYALPVGPATLLGPAAPLALPFVGLLLFVGFLAALIGKSDVPAGGAGLVAVILYSAFANYRKK